MHHHPLISGKPLPPNVATQGKSVPTAAYGTTSASKPGLTPPVGQWYGDNPIKDALENEDSEAPVIILIPYESNSPAQLMMSTNSSQFILFTTTVLATRQRLLSRFF